MIWDLDHTAVIGDAWLIFSLVLSLSKGWYWLFRGLSRHSSTREAADLPDGPPCKVGEVQLDAYSQYTTQT
jgi:cbb3-type cytochrome oxidase subunit 3